jgi:hypothetical protein
MKIVNTTKTGQPINKGASDIDTAAWNKRVSSVMEAEADFNAAHERYRDAIIRRDGLRGFSAAHPFQTHERARAYGWRQNRAGEWIAPDTFTDIDGANDATDMVAYECDADATDDADAKHEEELAKAREEAASYERINAETIERRLARYNVKLARALERLTQHRMSGAQPSLSLFGLPVVGSADHEGFRKKEVELSVEADILATAVDYLSDHARCARRNSR